MTAHLIIGALAVAVVAVGYYFDPNRRPEQERHMTPTERHEQDARIQSAALRHYAQKCRYAADDGGNAVASKEQLQGWAERADKLADAYDRLQIGIIKESAR